MGFLKKDLRVKFKILLLQPQSGCSVARYRATFGMWRPQVRILPSRRYQLRALTKVGAFFVFEIRQIHLSF